MRVGGHRTWGMGGAFHQKERELGSNTAGYQTLGRSLPVSGSVTRPSPCEIGLVEEPFKLVSLIYFLQARCDVYSFTPFSNPVRWALRIPFTWSSVAASGSTGARTQASLTPYTVILPGAVSLNNGLFLSRSHCRTLGKFPSLPRPAFACLSKRWFRVEYTWGVVIIPTCLIGNDRTQEKFTTVPDT